MSTLDELRAAFADPRKRSVLLAGAGGVTVLALRARKKTAAASAAPAAGGTAGGFTGFGIAPSSVGNAGAVGTSTNSSTNGYSEAIAAALNGLNGAQADLRGVTAQVTTDTAAAAAQAATTAADAAVARGVAATTVAGPSFNPSKLVADIVRPGDPARAVYEYDPGTGQLQWIQNESQAVAKYGTDYGSKITRVNDVAELGKIIGQNPGKV